MRRMAMAGGLALAVSAFMLIAAPVAGATTYNNDTPIIIPTQGTANPYPSSITVSGTAGPITDVNVGLDGLSHNVPDDVAIALVAPGGQALLMQSCVGDVDNAAVGVFLTFDDAAAAQPPNNGPLATGTFKPAAYCTGTVSFPEPGPLASSSDPAPAGTATFASVFNGLSAIGTWNLYVIDNFALNSGSIPGGWSLDIKPDVTPLPATTPTPTPAPAPSLTCGTGTVQEGSQCVVKKKKKKKKRKRRKK